jgi:hypothetical protein
MRANAKTNDEPCGQGTMNRLLIAGIAVLAGSMAGQASATTFCFTNGAKFTYGAGGKYRFSQNGGTWFGSWTGNPTAGGSVDVRLDGGRTRHDRFEREGKRLVMISDTGGHFPLRECR